MAGAFDGGCVLEWAAFACAGWLFAFAGWALALGSWALAGVLEGAWAFECAVWDFDWAFTGCDLDCDFDG